MNVIERLNIVRNAEDLNKSQFEKKLSKSSGYLNMLEKRDGNPGVDVIQKFVSVFPDYSLKWLLTGEGEMKKIETDKNHSANDDQEEYQLKNKTTLLDVRDDLKADLAVIANGMTTNFEKVANALFESLKGQQKIIRFIDKIDADRINKATGKLDEFFESKQK